MAYNFAALEDERAQALGRLKQMATQKQAWADQMYQEEQDRIAKQQKYDKSYHWQDMIAPTLTGAATGFMMGGPWGALAGAGMGAIGSGLGQYDRVQKAKRGIYNGTDITSQYTIPGAALAGKFAGYLAEPKETWTTVGSTTHGYGGDEDDMVNGMGPTTRPNSAQYNAYQKYNDGASGFKAALNTSSRDAGLEPPFQKKTKYDF